LPRKIFYYYMRKINTKAGYKLRSQIFLINSTVGVMNGAGLFGSLNPLELATMTLWS